MGNVNELNRIEPKETIMNELNELLPQLSVTKVRKTQEIDTSYHNETFELDKMDENYAILMKRLIGLRLSLSKMGATTL